MNPAYERALESLSPIQREAVEWHDGSALVLAGPGAGKTRVLTTRIARLLGETEGRKFKVLALTFTTKAAKEMRERVEALLPGLAEDRTFIGTFHSFCTHVLRQHGSHIGISPDFGIYDQRKEREALLLDALQSAAAEGQEFSAEDLRWLDAIDKMKERVIVPEKVGDRIRDARMPLVYALYEQALRNENALDFNGLILETCRLLAEVPAVSKRLRTVYPYWMIDEFQDTSPAQYWFLHYMAGEDFKNVFSVADDDQIIYQWAGASYRQIERFREQYQPTLIQLVENHRCPSEVVEIANRLVANNTQRTPDKKPIVATRRASESSVAVSIFDTESDERLAVATEIVALGAEAWGDTAIIARTRYLLEPMLAVLKENSVKAVLAQRRDSFVSPHFVWLETLFDQILHPANKREFATLVNTANRIAGSDFDPAVLAAEAEANGRTAVEHWGVILGSSDLSRCQKMGEWTSALVHSRDVWKKVVKEAIPFLLAIEVEDSGGAGDVAEDSSAWNACMRDIRAELGSGESLSEVMQGLALRSKEPPIEPGTVTLLTVHGSKGLEFNNVYLIGAAEGEMPSWQSVAKGDTSVEMEEERRNCFVAITRTKNRLRISTARVYKGRQKPPSRFLVEMALV